MHDFKLKRGKLFCEEVDLKRVADKIGTPVYVYSRRTLLSHFRKLKKAFAEVSPLICFSMKANSNLALCRMLVKEGAGIDIVSGGELFRARKIKTPAKKIVYASVGKTSEEITAAVKAGILFFNVESLAELRNIDRIAKGLNKVQKVAIRINPDVEAHTHHYITTAKKQNKFGIDIKAARSIIIKESRRLKHVDICGIHVHIGSQIEQVNPFVQSLKISLKLIDELNAKGARITYLNIGGGLGIIYNKEKPQTADEYARAILPLLRGRNLELIMEPGRFIAGNAGVLLTEIIYVKDTPVKRFYIVDTAMNDLVRPSFYGAYHEVVPLKEGKEKKRRKADVVGPVCESGDFLAKDRMLPGLKQGDRLALMSAGAYGFTMSSNYNSRRRAAEVLVDGDKFHVIRKRETFNDLIRNEVI